MILYFTDTATQPDGKVKKHWKRVSDAAKHPAQVLEALRGG